MNARRKRQAPTPADPAGVGLRIEEINAILGLEAGNVAPACALLMSRVPLSQALRKAIADHLESPPKRGPGRPPATALKRVQKEIEAVLLEAAYQGVREHLKGRTDKYGKKSANAILADLNGFASDEVTRKKRRPAAKMREYLKTPIPTEYGAKKSGR